MKNYEKDIKIHLKDKQTEQLIEEEYHREIVRWVEGERETKPAKNANILRKPKKGLTNS